MHKFFIAVFTLNFFNYSSSRDMYDLCQTQNVVTVENAFRVNDVLVMLTKTNGKSLPIRVRGFKFNTEDKNIRIGSVEVWNGWNTEKGSIQVDKMPVIHSTFRFSFPDKRSPLIIATYDQSDKSAKHLIGYEVEYNSEVTQIETIKAFKINPYEATDAGDVMNIKSLFANFPDDYQTYAKPVIPFPVNEENLPNRAFLYYYETNPNGLNQIKYRVHIMIYNKTVVNGKEESLWTHDANSGECVDLDKDNRVDSGMAISDYSTLNKTHKSFEIIEFYPNGEFQIKRIIIDAISLENNRLSDTYWETMFSSNIKDIVCHGFVATSYPSTTSNSDTSQTSRPGLTLDLASGSTLSSDSSPSTSKLSNEGSEGLSSKWIFTLVVILFIILLLFTLVLYFCLKKKQGYGEKYEAKESKEAVELTALRPLPDSDTIRQTEKSATAQKVDSGSVAENISYESVTSIQSTEKV